MEKNKKFSNGASMLKMAALTAAVVVLAGCGNKVDKKNTPETGGGKVENKTEEKKGGMISSIKDAMGLGKEMKCAYKMKLGQDTLETVTYVKGKKYMGETNIAGKVQKIVFDEEALYTWSPEEKKGTKFGLACMKELNPEQISSEENNNAYETTDPTGEKTFDQAMDVKCEPSSGADFSVPSDVQFTDQCEMMKNLMKNIPANIPGAPGAIPGNLPSGLPEGVEPM